MTSCFVTFLRADKVHHVNSRFEALFYCEIVLSVLYLVAKEKDERRIQEDKERSHHTRG